MLCASGERVVCVVRETEGEERAAARAMSAVVGREALREGVQQQSGRRGCCVPAKTQGVVARDRSGGRHVPCVQ